MTICIENNEKWFDVCTLVVPRPDVNNMVKSFFSHVDRRGFKLRWIVNYDPVPELMHNHLKCKSSLEKLSSSFDDFLLIENKENIMHKKSFLNVMRAVESDFCIYIEDDKIFNSDFSLQELTKIRPDYVSLDGNTKPGNTGVGIWSKRFVNSAENNEKILTTQTNIEMLNKRVFADNCFKRTHSINIAYDNGLKSLRNESLMRTLTEGREPKYKKLPSLTFVVFEKNGFRYQFLSERREWNLCESSFEKIWIPKGEEINVRSIESEWIALISSDLIPMSKAKTIFSRLTNDINVIIMEGFEDSLIFLKTEIARKFASKSKYICANELIKAVLNAIKIGEIMSFCTIERQKLNFIRLAEKKK